MSVAGLERRLAKLESRHGSADDQWLIIWGRSAPELEEIAAGFEYRPKHVFAGVWQGDGDCPPSRLLNLDDIPQHELEALVAVYRAAGIRQERKLAAAAGENVSTLDETDFYIRHLRRGKLHDILRTLANKENPIPQIHAQPCDCPTCRTGETHPRVWSEWQARLKAWQARYMPETLPIRTAGEMVH
jgi:hypothetical protein